MLATIQSRTFCLLVCCLKAYFFLVIPYGYITWSLTLRKEHACKLRVSELSVLRRIVGPKRDEVTEGWRKLHNEELRNLYSSPSIIRMIKLRRVTLGRACSTNAVDVKCMGAINRKARRKQTTRKTET
jgi:hypothetical protein